MIIQDLLEPSEVAEARAVMAAADFTDGRETAGWHASLVKLNEQAKRGPAPVEALRKRLAERIANNALFKLWVRPKALTPLLLSRYRPGMNYGSHVDDALMNGQRCDVSFTLFLADPESYDGGGLVIEDSSGEDEIKLPAGSLIAYPATTLHRVEPVTRGERLAAVGWARSFIRDAAARELLFDLDTARQAIFDKDGKTPAFDLISKSLANLIRRWADD